jgi:acetylornithine deacetylase/succinyl-diaminopimelate desuccinylase-like protein
MAGSVSAASPFVDQAPQRLADYIKVDTTNPPGNEVRGVAFFAAIFDAAGIKYETAESAPGRGNIWARIKGGRKPALILLNHMDVVPADERYWDVDPLGGVVKDGYIWGRGALDMKGTGIMQLQAFLALAASGSKPNRDVVFVATADEEAGGAYGAGWLAENRTSIFKGAGFLVNEGGYATQVKGDRLFMVEVTQKVPLWLRLTAADRPGHGSSPTRTTAITRILRAGNRMAETRFEARAIPAVAQLFAGLAPYQEKSLQAAYEDIGQALEDDLFMRKLEELNPSHHALLRNTCSLTTLEGSSKINVIPPQAVLELDCRMLPDQDEAAFVEQIRTIVNDPNIEIHKIMSLKPAVSPTKGALWDAISALVAQRYDNAKVIPSVSTGFTDSQFFRAMGIDSYGLGLFVVPRSDIRGVHGNNERLGVENLEQATASMIELLAQFTQR